MDVIHDSIIFSTISLISNANDVLKRHNCENVYASSLQAVQSYYVLPIILSNVSIAPHVNQSINQAQVDFGLPIERVICEVGIEKDLHFSGNVAHLKSETHTSYRVFIKRQGQSSGVAQIIDRLNKR